MVDRIVWAVITALLCVITWILAGLLSWFPLQTVEQGPQVLYATTLVGVLVIGVGGWWISGLAVDDDGWLMSSRLGCAVAIALRSAFTLVGVFCFALLPVGAALFTHRIAQEMREQAPEIRELGLRYFDAIDADGDKTLTKAELEAKVNDADQELASAASRMQKHLSAIGHSIGSDRTLILIPDPSTPGVTSQHWITTSIYGISREDLESFPDRTVRKYELW